MSPSERASNHVGSSNNLSLLVASQLPAASNQVQGSGVNSTPVVVAPAIRPREEAADEDPIIAEEKKKLRSVRSNVWIDFERSVGKKIVKGKEVGILMAECKHCKKRMPAPSNQGTSRLHRHANTCKENPENKKGQRNITTIKIGNAQTKLANWKYDVDDTRILVAKMIAKHGYPITIVEHPYFREFVKSLNPSAKLYTRNTVRDDIMKITTEFKLQLQEQFETITSKCSLTTDMWTCKHTKYGYCCVTMHYIDDE